MKKVFFFIIILVHIIKIGKAQTSVYHPFLNESYWNVNVSFFNMNNYYSYSTVGDTLINNLGYKKIKKVVGNSIPDTILCLREDITTKSVFLWNGINDMPLYSFDLIIGSYVFVNTGSLCGMYMYQVSYIDSVQLGFGFTKRFYLTSMNQAYPPAFYIIEGVGSIIEPITLISCTIDPSYSVVCNSQNGVQIYGSNCSQMPPPNSVENNEINETPAYWISTSNNQFTVNTNQLIDAPIDLNIFDLSGKLIVQYKNIQPNNSQIVPFISAGLYLITISNSSGFKTTQKLFWGN
jgi:hypothetical protein